MKFCEEKKEYKRSTKHHRLRLFRRILRKCTGNEKLDYDGFMGISDPPKLKHIVSSEEMQFHEILEPEKFNY